VKGLPIALRIKKANPESLRVCKMGARDSDLAQFEVATCVEVGREILT